MLLIKAVVLLDEADVFLEERSLTDLKRNALVSGESTPAIRITSILILMPSVFLRVLEYYDGNSPLLLLPSLSPQSSEHAS